MGMNGVNSPRKTEDKIYSPSTLAQASVKGTDQQFTTDWYQGNLLLIV